MKGRIIYKTDGTKRYTINGVPVTEEEFNSVFPDQPMTNDGSVLFGWQPIESLAMCVHPNQVEEARACAVKQGVPTEYLPTGEPVFTSRSHRKAFLRAKGVHDNGGGYGD